MNIFLSNPAVFCCAGSNSAEFYESLINANQKGIKKVELQLRSENEKKSFFVGKIDDEKFKNVIPEFKKYDSRFLRLEESALCQIENEVFEAIKFYGKERIGVCVGQCDNGSELSLNAHKYFFEKGSFPENYEIEEQGASMATSYVSKKFDVSGPSISFATACSSSASALIKARELILSGICDAVIAGGVDVASATVLLGFESLQAVQKDKITNPFSKNRAGITLGEGAGFFVLTKDDIFNTKIILSGCGESSDANHMTAPLEDGSGARIAMEKALENANLIAENIDYINLHGTGTHLNDSMEAKAVNSVFGEKIPVSSTKPVTGHTLGAAGVLELAACFLAVENGILPVHIWDNVFDEKIPKLNFVSKSENRSNEKKEIKCCMSNSFAFGGANASLIIKKSENKE